MGFLDHSTNNIIVDAVLTDLGRQALAKNDGSFNIYQFALGDDEVDYNVIKHFGRTVGKEKIEKNTPVIEALTAGSLSLKNKLLSISNEALTFLPTMTLSIANETGSVINLSRSSGGVKTKQLQVLIESSQVGIDDDLIDGEFRVELNQTFLGITGEAADVVFTDNIAIYRYPAGFGDTTDTINVTIPIFLKNITQTTFNTFSIANGSYIRTFIKVIGINSGLTKSIEVQIS